MPAPIATRWALYREHHACRLAAWKTPASRFPDASAYEIATFGHFIESVPSISRVCQWPSTVLPALFFRAILLVLGGAHFKCPKVETLYEEGALGARGW